jgi:hypothetical protein
VGAKAVAGHAQRIGAQGVPGRLAGRRAACHLVDGKAQVGHAGQQLLGACSGPQCTEAGAQRVAVAAGMLHMQHGHAGGTPGLAPGIAAVAAAAQAM